MTGHHLRESGKKEKYKAASQVKEGRPAYLRAGDGGHFSFVYLAYHSCFIALRTLSGGVRGSQAKMNPPASLPEDAEAWERRKYGKISKNIDRFIG